MPRIARKSVALFICSVALALPAYTVSLDTLLQKALDQSPSMHSLELTKNNAELTLSIKEEDKQLGVELTSGEVSSTYLSSLSAYGFRTSGAEATFTLPDDGATTISVGTGSVAYTPNGNYYSIAPAVAGSHTFTIGYQDDTSTTLTNEQTALASASSYEKNKILFERSLLDTITNLIKNEQNTKQTQKDRADLQKALSDDQTLRLVHEGSVAFAARKQALDAKDQALESYTKTRPLLLQQFEQLSSFPWEGLDEIPLPKLAFKQNAAGNSTVKKAQYDLDIAQENLKVYEASLTNSAIVVQGGVTLYTSYTGSLGSPASYGLSTKNGAQAHIGATYKAKNVTLGTSFSADNTSGSITPTFTVSGTWTNDTTTATEQKTLLQMQNKVVLAQIAYNDALSTYLHDANALGQSIASWNLKYALLQSSQDYNKQYLDQQKQLLSKGLATQKTIDDASFAVEMDSYSLATLLLEGISLELDIRNLNI